MLIALLYNANPLYVHDQCLSVFTGSFVCAAISSVSVSRLISHLQLFGTCSCTVRWFHVHYSQLQLLSSLLL